jgi:hypothetical protein
VGTTGDNYDGEHRLSGLLEPQPCHMDIRTGCAGSRPVVALYPTDNERSKWGAGSMSLHAVAISPAYASSS